MILRVNSDFPGLGLVPILHLVVVRLPLARSKLVKLFQSGIQASSCKVECTGENEPDKMQILWRTSLFNLRVSTIKQCGEIIIMITSSVQYKSQMKDDTSISKTSVNLWNSVLMDESQHYFGELPWSLVCIVYPSLNVYCELPYQLIFI